LSARTLERLASAMAPPRAGFRKIPVSLGRCRPNHLPATWGVTCDTASSASFPRPYSRV